MTYRWIDDQNTLRKLLGERRKDPWTASLIEEALRTGSSSSAARLMAYRRVDFEIALRVLSTPGKRRRSA
jgi:hypothetical protein